jgi:hypothetical protein
MSKEFYKGDDATAADSSLNLEVEMNNSADDVKKVQVLDPELGKTEDSADNADLKDVELTEHDKDDDVDERSSGPSWHYGARRATSIKNVGEIRLLRMNSVVMFCIMFILVFVPLLSLLFFWISRQI